MLWLTMADGILVLTDNLKPAKTQILTIWPFAEKKIISDVEQKFSNGSIHQTHPEDSINSPSLNPIPSFRMS